MPGETMTTYQGVLKQFYGAQGIVNQLNVETFLLSKLEKAREAQLVGGEFFTKPILLQLSGAVGGRAEGAELPAAGNYSYGRVQIPLKYLYGTIQLSNQVIALSKTDKMAFAQALALTMENMFNEFRLFANIVLYGWGSGIVGVVSSVSTNNITLADDIHPMTWFYPGQKLWAYQSDESTRRGSTEMTVTAVNYTGRVVSVDSAVSGLASTDRLVLAGSLNAVPYGLLAGIDDGTYVSNYLNISRSSNASWKSYVSAYGTPAKYGSSNRRTLTTDLIQAALDQQRIRAGATRGIDQFISSLEVRRQYFNMLSPDARFSGRVFDGGWEQLVYSNGDKQIPWYGDEFAPRYTVFGLHLNASPLTIKNSGMPEGTSPVKVQEEELFAIYQGMEPEWDETGGQQLKQVYGSSAGTLVDAVMAFLKWYVQFATLRPNVHLRIDDLTA
jgi:hypothetical protein